MKLENLKEKGMKLKEMIFGSINEKRETRRKQIKVAQVTLDNVVYTAEHNNVPMTKEEIEAAKEAARLLHEADKADMDKIECWTRIGTAIVKTVVYVGLGIAAYELNKQMTLLVFNEQLSNVGGKPIDIRSLNGLMKANDSLKRDIMNNLNKRDGILS